MSIDVFTLTTEAASNAAPVTITLPLSPEGKPIYTKHLLKVTATGTPLAGTATLALDGILTTDAIDFTDGLLKTIDGPVETILVTPSSLTSGCVAKTVLKSWND